AAAYGEFWVGSGREFHSIVMLTLGTGVGGGIIIGDLNVEGEHSHGSECGHIIVDNSPHARMCGCGQPGHLEAYCSATALIQRAQGELDRGSATTLRSRVQAGEDLSGLMIAEEAERGD
ncbi:MAG: ROK family protein, partial [Pirellulaceae bacterium]